MKSETKLFNAKSEEGGTELKNLIHYCCKVKIEHDFSPSVVKISLSKKTHLVTDSAQVSYDSVAPSIFLYKVLPISKACKLRILQC